MPLAWPKRPTLQTRTHSAPDGTSLRQRQPAAKPEECTAIPQIREEGSQIPPAKVPELSGSLSKSSGWSRYPHVDIAVLGATGSGKSTFIQHTLDLKTTPTSRVSAKKMSLEGQIYLVRLHEIEISEGRIIWPHSLYGRPLPPMDGIITLFDSSDLSTIIHHSQIFSSLTKTGIPVVIAACKCDLPPSADTTMFEQTKQLLGCVKVHRTAINDDASHKKCVSSILNQISHRPDWISRFADSRCSDDSFSTNNSQTRQHVRASSENPPPVSSYANERFRYALESEASNLNPTKPLDQPRKDSTSSHLMPPHTPSRSQFSIESRQSLSSQGSDGVTIASFTDNTNNTPGENPAMPTGDDRSEAIRPAESESVTSTPSSGNADQGYTFEELFNRVASLPKSETDVRFSTVFFIVYRKFATPMRLLNAFIDHYHKLEQETLLLRQYGLQLRLITMLTQLVREHPGDFADPKTKKRLMEFTDLIEAEYLFTYFAKEIHNALAKPTEDFDKGWAFTDEEFSDESEDQTLPADSTLGPDDAASSAVGSNLTQVTSMSATDSLGVSSSSTNAESSIFSRPELPCEASDTIMAMEHAQQLARTLVVRPSIPMRESWRIFDSVDVDDFAHQITRMDWIMYRAFRGREMFRHANTPMDKRDSEPGLEHINRMVDSFNGLALFVVSMILFPEKAKHRARTIEKFSKIAIKLRELNNYNSCGAIIAGFERAPVHRLTETRVLACKAYKSVWTLMSTSRSYSTYRLAFQNTYAQKIAFLPTHLSDLFRADQGNPTFIGPNKDRINWKKFDMVGSMILDVQQSQEMPYNSFRRFSKGDPADDPANADMPKQEKKSHDIFYMDLKKCPLVKELILKSERYGQEEDIISRSWQIEPPMGYEPHRRRFESLFGRRSRD